MLWLVVVDPPRPFFGLGAVLWVFLGRPARTSVAGQAGRAAPSAPAPNPSPEADRHANRVVTDRRSAELDRMLEEWERTRRGEGTPEP